MGCGNSKAADGATVCIFVPQDTSLEQQREAFDQRDKQRLEYSYNWDIAPAFLSSIPLRDVPVKELQDYMYIGLKLDASKAEQWHNIIESRLQKCVGWKKSNSNGKAFEEYTQVFDGNLPAGAHDWQHDHNFSFQRVNGMFPWFIRRATLAEYDFPVTDALLAKQLGNHKLADLEKTGRLFVVSHPQLANIPHPAERVMTAPIELHWVDDKGELAPLAIQLAQSSKDSPVFTKNDPENVWLAAKIHASSANLVANSLLIHAMQMHLLSETIWLAAVRNLNEQHPLRLFLTPHFRNIFFINDAIRKEFAPGGSFRIFAPGFEGNVELMRRGFANFRFSQLDVAADFEERGVSSIPKFWFRDDALRLWECHSTYIKKIVESFYPSDEVIAGDYELQAWAHEMADPLFGAIAGLPVNAQHQFTNRDQLIKFITSIFYNVTTRHSYVENVGVNYFGFVPANPAHFRLPIPKDNTDIPIETIVAALPELSDAVLQTALIDSVSTAVPEVVRLTAQPSDYMKDSPKPVQDAIKAWKTSLAEIDQAIDNRNKQIGIPFTHFKPINQANQIWS
jgi:hypothetical protein